MSLRKIGDYTITRMIGRGAMGTVYQALSPEGVTVAVKTVLWPEGAGTRARWDAIARFQREAHAARSLSHPNICQVLDCGADENSLFIVMEFLDGDTVQQLIDLAGPIELKRAVQIVRGVAEGLAHAHDQGIIHRDVKPGNIMILRTGQVKLADFGLASVIGERGLTRNGYSPGTPPYMSPEQVHGDRVVDARSDVFSLGATFYEMVTGTRAFPAADTWALRQQILTRHPPLPRDVPAYVSLTLEKCLRKKPEERFQSARELIASLLEAEPRVEPTVVRRETEEKLAARPRRGLPVLAQVRTWWPAVAALALAVLGAALLRPATREPTVVARYPPHLTPVKEGVVATYVYGGAGRIQGIAARPDGTLLVTVGAGERVAPGVYVARPGDDLDASDAYTRPGVPFKSPGGIAVHPDGRVLVADREASTVWEIASRGARPHPLAKIPGASDVLVSPEGFAGHEVNPGDVLVCNSSPADQAELGLYVIQAGRRTPHRLVGPSQLTRGIVNAEFASGGTLLFAVEDTLHRQQCTIMTVTPEGDVTRAVHDLGYGLSPCTGSIAVHPTGGELYFGARETVYRLPAKGGKGEDYARGSEEITALASGPDGSSLLVGLFDSRTGAGTLARIGPYPIDGRLLVSAWRESKPPSGEQEFAYLWEGSTESKTRIVTYVPDPEDMAPGSRDLSPFTDEMVYFVEWPLEPERPSDKRSQVWKSDLGGGNRVPLAGGQLAMGINCLPLWSPDGGRIAFLHCAPKEGEDPCATGLDLWVMNADGNGAELEASAPTGESLGSRSSPTVSWDPGGGPPIVKYGTQGPLVTKSPPDGSRTVGERTKAGELDGKKGVWRQLCLADSDGRDERVLVEWFLADSDIASHLEDQKKDPDDRKLRDDAREWLGPRHVTWSPSGDRVAFLGVPGDDFDPDGDYFKYQVEVWVYELSTGILAKLTNNADAEIGLSWRPDVPQAARVHRGR